MTAVIEARNLSKTYRLYGNPYDRLFEALPWSKGPRHRKIHALQDVTFDVEPGECMGLIGVNGAGSGAIDFATAVLALYHNTVPPSANTDGLLADCRLPFVQDEPVDANAEYAVTLAYALSGSQVAALVIQKYVE